MIKCPNPDCQASNSEGNLQCTSCQSFVPHRYLWATGHGKLGPNQLGKRYVWKHQRVVLDTQPGLPPMTPEPLPANIWPYLMLAPHSLHVPQPYALLQDTPGEEILLLDAAAIGPTSGKRAPRLLPTLAETWPKTSPLRQLNWLWQIAGLWPEFTEQQVAGNLLVNDCLRVDGAIVRLLELLPDDQVLTLEALGASWQTLVPQAHASIRDFLDSVTTQLCQGQIATSEMLIASLDQAIATVAADGQVEYRMSVVTDQGPSRKRNEDACYPNSGTAHVHALGPKTKLKDRHPLLLLVCDGIGGHDGGDVASHLAIATIQQKLAPLLQQLTTQPAHDTTTVTLAIEQAICAANDRIAEHNDQGMRQARDRMGTTLVMVLIVGIQIYIAHIGDSRAYRVSASSCRQVTFDDDVAAREVRLGYGFYADLTHRPGTGALIQALGMGHSSSLHIASQRLILDDDVALILCSDGLSDYDRVEQFWEAQVLPVLSNHVKPAKAATSLVQLANQYNGHDNVTVGIVAGRLHSLEPVSVPVFSKPLPTAIASPQTQTLVASSTPPLAPGKQSSTPWLLMLLGLIATLGGATAATILFFEAPFSRPSSSSTPVPAETIPEQISQNHQDVGIADNQLSAPSLAPRSYLQLLQPVALQMSPQTTAGDNTLGQVPDGAIVQVITRQDPAADQVRWVKLKVCAVNLQGQSPGQSLAGTEAPIASAATSTPTTTEKSTVTSSQSTSLPSGSEGWILEAQLAQIARTAEVLNCPPE